CEKYLLGSSSVLTSSRRSDLPSKSVMSSRARLTPMLDNTPPAATFTETTAFTVVVFSADVTTALTTV
ncbi:hypothetical protein U1Q18_032155, partial [Sarracenia purpurea var. burkii]